MIWLETLDFFYWTLYYFPSIYQSFNGSSEVLVTEKIIKAILLVFFPKSLKMSIY